MKDELSNIDIDKICKGRVPGYMGCCCKDQLPKRVLPNTCYVINCQNEFAGDMQGTHWMALYVTGDRRIYFMEPFGMPPPNAVREWAGDCPLYYQTMQIQNDNSENCGWWCIWFLMHSPQLGFKNLLKTFTKDTVENEKILEEWKKKLK